MTERQNNFAAGEKLNIGSGIRNWTNWLCYDELDATGVTKGKFNENTQFPIKDNKISLFYYKLETMRQIYTSDPSDPSSDPSIVSGFIFNVTGFKFSNATSSFV